MSDQLRDNIQKVLQRISSAAKKANRDPRNIKLMLASKSRSSNEITDAALALKNLGLEQLFGENYWQELKEKLNETSNEIQFHFIGRLQSNKIKELVENNIVIQSIATKKHLDEVKKVALNLKLTPKVFIQVNASEDKKKAGFSISETEEVLSLDFAPVKVVGLMTILELVDNKESLREDYRKMRELRGARDLILSMGMSDDLEIAIEEGSDMVRVGTAIFGERQRKI